MLDYLQIENFKSIKKLCLRFGKLNLLFGCNGMGKSSVLQSILLLRQSGWKNKDFSKLCINGDLAELGNGKDIFCQMTEEDYIRFVVKGSGHMNDVRYRYETFSDQLEQMDGSNVSVADIDDVRFVYLSAGHIQPQVSYSMKNWERAGINPLGNAGEYVVPFLAENGDKMKVAKELCLRAASDSLLDQVTAWMKIISPGVRLSARKEDKLQEAYLDVSYDCRNLTMETVSPVNAAFGITYALPVIVALLISDNNSLLLLENPESHLHPKGQRAIGELMAKAANRGAQIICESHSDHIINGVRVAVKKRYMDCDDLAVLYFSKDDNQLTEAIPINVDKDGNLLEYPSGLLDEWGNAMMELLEG